MSDSDSFGSFFDDSSDSEILKDENEELDYDDSPKKKTKKSVKAPSTKKAKTTTSATKSKAPKPSTKETNSTSTTSTTLKQKVATSLVKKNVESKPLGGLNLPPPRRVGLLRHDPVSHLHPIKS